MDRDTFTTKVIFRAWHKTGEIIAIFPELPGTHHVNTCESYMHIGQHGACNPRFLINEETRPATPAEYADLQSELESIGYRLEICERYRYSMTVARRELMKAYNANIHLMTLS